MPELTKADIEKWLVTEEEEFYIDGFRQRHNISPESSTLYVTFERLCEERKLKRVGRGIYKKIKQIPSVKKIDVSNQTIYDFKFPCSHSDNSSFGFDDLIRVYGGNAIVVVGVPNYGKTAFILNLLGENAHKHPCLLMGNEYSREDGKVSQGFSERLVNMNWSNLVNEDGTLNFDLKLIEKDYEEYVQRDYINLIDWILLTDEPYKIGEIIKAAKSRCGDGLVVIVLQKKRGSDLGIGGQYTEHFADVYFTIDPYGEWQSRITVGKVKSPKGRVTGRSWAFSIVDNGANLHNIREVVKCLKCKGSGYTKSGKCDSCEGYGWLEDDTQ